MSLRWLNNQLEIAKFDKRNLAYTSGFEKLIELGAEKAQIDPIHQKSSYEEISEYNTKINRLTKSMSDEPLTRNDLRVMEYVLSLNKISNKHEEHKF